MKKIRLRVELETKTFFNLGMGGVIDSDVDIVFSRIFLGEKEYLSIPGSSIKGVLRKNAASVAEYLGLKACYGISPEDISRGVREGCDVCSLFGFPDGESRVYVRSVFLDLNTIILTRIRVDIKTCKVIEKALFKEEVLPPMTRFSFELEFFPKNVKEEKLIMLSINELNYQKFGKAGSVEVKEVKILEGELDLETVNMCEKIGLRVVKL